MEKAEPSAVASTLGPSRSAPGFRQPGGLPAPLATNSWARRTILARAQLIGLRPELAKQVGNIALWYYNRILLRHTGKGPSEEELPHSTNRYLVPISLALACRYKSQPVELDRLLRLSGNPTKATIENAHRYFALYSELLGSSRSAPIPTRPGRPTTPRAASSSQRPPTPPQPQFRPATPHRPPGSVAARGASSRASSSPAVAAPLATALAIPLFSEVLELRRRLDLPRAAAAPSRPPPKPRQQNSNAWARKRIAELSGTLGLPEHVRRRALDFYERIVDLHSRKGHAPPGKRVQLSPRLNWSLVSTTIYLGCRFEEYPKDLRAILGGNPPRGRLREMYRLYRFYKRELRLPINQVDVKTFILSWIDGFEVSEVLREKAANGELAWIRQRAITIATRARGDRSMEKASTKVIAAGALTTALAERNPPSSLSKFYRIIARFLHMSEETIQLIVARIAQVL